MSISKELADTLGSLINIFFIRKSSILRISFPQNTSQESIKNFARYFYLSLRHPGEDEVYFSMPIFKSTKKETNTKSQLAIKIPSYIANGNIVSIQASRIDIRKGDIARLKIVGGNPSTIEDDFILQT